MMKCICGMYINIEVFYKFMQIFRVSVARHAQGSKSKFAYLYNISREPQAVKLIFCLQINTIVLFKLIVALWVCVARLAQRAQYNKFAMSLQYFKENVKDEVDFLSADKHQRCLQIDTTFQVCLTSHARTTQNNKFAMSLQCPKEEVSDEVDFLRANKHGRFLQIGTVFF